MKRPFREYHTLEIFNAFEMQTGPLDLFLKNYFYLHKAIGAKDRKAIADAIYDIIRWRGLLDYLITKPPSWEKRYHYLAHFCPKKYLPDESIPLHIRLSFPKILFETLEKSLSKDELIAFCLASNTTAPTTIRINTLKSSRSDLLTAWGSVFAISACDHAAHGITFHKKINLFGLKEFKEGWFEIQDEASQLIADLVAAKPGDHVLDFCAGGGGKSLAIAPKMQQKGQLYLHDIRAAALVQAKQRLKRAGVQNAQLLPYDAPYKASLKGKMDWVLVDAPCSGTGTLRRNPDSKWKFDNTTLCRLIEEQRAIFQEALSFAKPSGKIVYATCSVLREENAAQAAFFEQKHALRRIKEPFSSLPTLGGMDGFFGVVYEKIS